MCHGVKSAAFPDPGPFSTYSTAIQASIYGDEDASKKIAILPDIYGCNPFYQGFATHLAEKDARVFLVDIFAGLGDIPKATREAAFERRHALRDKTFVDSFEVFIDAESIDAVVGFCLGGLFVFELARRNVRPVLIGLYPFPQGLKNQDPLDVPFDYLPEVTKQHQILVGADDASLGPENLERLRAVSADNAALDLHVFETSGHGFLADLTSDDALKRENAELALEICERTLGFAADSATKG